MSKYIKLTPEQKDEIRRLTQLANRRIKAAQKAYSKEGKEVIPYEIAGKSDLQTKDKWHTKNTPMSRSVKFESEKDYRQQLNFLKRFDPKATPYAYRPGIKEYTEVQRQKIGQAVKSSLGEDVSFSLIEKKLEKLTAPQLSDFWNTFSENASRAGMHYSSEAVMEQTFIELFPEDLHNTLEGA